MHTHMFIYIYIFIHIRILHLECVAPVILKHPLLALITKHHTSVVQYGPSDPQRAMSGFGDGSQTDYSTNIQLTSTYTYTILQIPQIYNSTNSTNSTILQFYKKTNHKHIQTIPIILHIYKLLGRRFTRAGRDTSVTAGTSMPRASTSVEINTWTGHHHY